MIGRKMSHGRSSDCEVLGRGYAKMYLNDVNQNLLLYFKICFLVWLGPNSWSPFVFYVFFSIDQIMQEKLRFNIYTLSDVQVFSSVFFYWEFKAFAWTKMKTFNPCCQDRNCNGVRHVPFYQIEANQCISSSFFFDILHFGDGFFMIVCILVRS